MSVLTCDLIMKRRDLLKTVGLGVLGTAALPAWAHGWSPSSFEGYTFENKAFFEKAVDSIIPTTDTPGAKDIGAHLFVERMLKDCYAPEVLQSMNKTIEMLEKEAKSSYGKSFTELEATDVLALLKKNASGNRSISLLKNLTVRAYTNSQYYLVNQKNYEIAPAYFNGCVDIQ